MHRIAFGIATLLGIAIASPVFAANENVITQSKALAGNVTPGDTPGFPITINTPGAYVLGSGLDVTPGQWGIVVNANGVDIDMSGYTLSGNGNADYGVVGGYNDSRIHDGIITSFKASGMYIRGNAWAVENMRIQRDSGLGIDAAGKASLEVRNSVIASNGANGITCGARCRVEASTIDSNGNVGIRIESGILIGNLIVNHPNYGFTDLGDYDTGVVNNMISGNLLGGIPSDNQTLGGLALNPNGCFGRTCTVP